MGRKIEMKKIQDNTKCQVTFSKRRTSLIKKAEEISITCAVDVAFLAFSPSGRISKFCNRKRMEDVLHRYVNLPAEKRLSHIKNVQDKMEKLQELGAIKHEDGKLQFLNNQIQNLELQVEKNQIEVQYAEANLRDFEQNPAQEASLYQLLWCERNLQQSVEKIKERKKEILLMEKEGAMPCLYSSGGNSLHSVGTNSYNGQLQKQFEFWENSQYIYPENLFDDMLGKGNGKEVAGAYGASETRVQNNTFNASIPSSYGMHQFGGGVPETQIGSLPASFQNNTCNAQTPSRYAMHQPGIAFATETSNELTYAPSQVNLNHGYPHQYVRNYASDMDYHLWKQAPMPWQQAESKSSWENFADELRNFTENYLSNFQSRFPESCNNVKHLISANASNCWEKPMLQNQPDMVLKQMDMDTNEEGNGSNNTKNGNDYADNEIMVSLPPSTSGVPSDGLYDFFPSEGSLGDNAPWTQKIHDTHMRDWDT